MGAPEGNQFWKVRSSHGRKPRFATPEALLSACEEYFEWISENPLGESKVFCHQVYDKDAGTSTPVLTSATVPLMRAMTLTGLRVFLDVSAQCWSEYKQKEGFGEVIERIEEIIYTQKFEGAACNLLNANIIARDLGLKDHKEVEGSLTLEDIVCGMAEDE